MTRRKFPFTILSLSDMCANTKVLGLFSNCSMFPNEILLAAILNDLNHNVGSRIDDICTDFFNLQFARAGLIYCTSMHGLRVSLGVPNNGSHARILAD